MENAQKIEIFGLRRMSTTLSMQSLLEMIFSYPVHFLYFWKFSRSTTVHCPISTQYPFFVLISINIFRSFNAYFRMWFIFLFFLFFYPILLFFQLGKQLKSGNLKFHNGSMIDLRDFSNRFLDLNIITYENIADI